MAVSVDRVYQKVLAMANKEQRGYITPQEFNLFADFAQMDIFEQYFYDLEQRQRGTGNEFDYADIISNIEEKISMFTIVNTAVGSITDGVADVSSAVPNLYRLGSVKVLYSTVGATNYKAADKIQLNEINKYENSPLAAPTKFNPVYTKFSTVSDSHKIKVYPSPEAGDTVVVDYVRRPVKPNWTYIISTNNDALYNASAADHQDFELHGSEETNLVIKILQLAGVAIKDFNLVQAAGQKEANDIQQEKL
jgi:hypothetical protein